MRANIVIKSKFHTKNKILQHKVDLTKNDKKIKLYF